MGINEICFLIVALAAIGAIIFWVRECWDELPCSMFFWVNVAWDLLIVFLAALFGNPWGIIR